MFSGFYQIYFLLIVLVSLRLGVRRICILRTHSLLFSTMYIICVEYVFVSSLYLNVFRFVNKIPYFVKKIEKYFKEYFILTIYIHTCMCVCRTKVDMYTNTEIFDIYLITRLRILTCLLTYYSRLTTVYRF